MGTTRIGSPEANIPQDIQLVGSHIINEHCVFENNDGEATCNERKISNTFIIIILQGKSSCFLVLKPYVTSMAER